MTRFLLIRHALTDANGKRLAGRVAGIGLNEQGRKQASALAERLASLPIAAIYSSPLERAVETAEPVARLLAREVVSREEFQELDFGQWTDRDLAGIAGDPEFQRFNRVRSCAPAPGGEYMLQAQARVVAGLERLRSRHPAATVAVFSHGDIIKSAIAHYAGVPLDLFHRIEIDPASVSVVETDGSTIRILAVNHTTITPG